MICAAYANETYTMEIAVPSNEASVRESILPQALAQTLIRASGKNDIIDSPAIKAKLINASAFLQSYNYNVRYTENGAKTLFLTVNFDPQMINSLLNEPLEVTTLYIHNVRNLNAYSEIVKYVRHLRSVTAVNLISIDSDQVVLTAMNKGGFKTLQDEIKFDNKLTPINTSIQPNAIPTLQYRWANG